MFELWLAPAELAATDSTGCLLIECPSATRSWVAERYAQILERASRSVDRQLRLASESELKLLQALHASPPHGDITTPHTMPLVPHPIGDDHKEAV